MSAPATPKKRPLRCREIIERLNDRFGTDFTESERLFLQQVQHDAINKEEIRRTAQANPFDKFSLGVRPQLQELMIERMAGNDTFVTRALNDPEFQEIVFAGLLQAIFEAVTANPGQPPPVRMLVVRPAIMADHLHPPVEVAPLCRRMRTTP